MKPKSKQIEDPRVGDPELAWGGGEDPNYSDPAEWDWESMYHEHLKSERAREEREKNQPPRDKDEPF